MNPEAELALVALWENIVLSTGGVVQAALVVNKVNADNYEDGTEWATDVIKEINRLRLLEVECLKTKTPLPKATLEEQLAALDYVVRTWSHGLKE